MSQPSVLLVALLLLALGALGMASNALWLRRRVTAPLRRMAAAADAVAGGDLTPVLGEMSGTAEVRQRVYVNAEFNVDVYLVRPT